MSPIFLRNLNRIALAAMGIVIGVYAWTVWAHALNLPYQDDILDILGFLIRFQDSQNAAEMFSAFWEQHNDHRTAASRLAYLLFQQVQGQVDFRTLTLFINLAPLAFVLFFATRLPRDRSCLALLCLPPALLMLQPVAYGLMGFPMAAFAMYGAFVYSVLCFLRLQRLTPLSLSVAMVLATLATFSLASGQFVWLLGVVAIVGGARATGKSWLPLLFPWLLVAGLVLWLFHFGHRSPNTPGLTLSLLLQNPLKHMLYLLGLLGSSISLGNLLSAQIVGALALALLFFLSCLEPGKLSTPIFLTAWFCLLSCVAIVLGRAPYTQIETAVVTRYSVPSQIFLCAVWVLCLRHSISLRVVLCTTVVLLLVNIASYRLYLPKLNASHDSRIQAFEADKWPTFGKSGMVTKNIVKEAIIRDIYRPPEVLR